MTPALFDLAIIGAGIVGASAAYFAALRKPSWEVVLLERSLVGSGTTLYSAGLDFPFGRTPYQKRLTRESQRAYRELKGKVPALPVRELPLYGVTSRESLEQVLAKFTHEDVRPASDGEREQLERSYPGLRVGPEQVLLSGGLASYGAAAQVAQTFVGLFKEGAGARCWEGVEVVSLERPDEAFTLRTSDGRVIRARRVLAATGPWMLGGPGGEAAREAGVRIKKVAALHVARRPPADAPMIYFFDEDAFLLPVQERGEWVFSFTSQEWDCPPEISRLKISVEDRTAALAVLERYCPAFAADCYGGRVFCDAYSLDRAPLICRAPGMADFVLAGACSGAGYRLAPAIAQEALRQFTDFAPAGEGEVTE